jgi:hypothetical protein
MLHFLLIVLHALSGVIAFVAGWMSIIRLRTKPLSGLLWLYLGSLVGLVVFMSGAILIDWPQLSTVQLLIYLGLFALGIYMLVQGYQAYAVQQKHDQGWKVSYVDHVGFTLIALFDGFVIVSAIDLGVPAWGVVVIGVLGVVVGRYAINRARSTIAPRAFSAGMRG